MRSTQLANRTLWFDGDSSFDPNTLLLAIQQHAIKYVDYPTAQIDEYNRHVSKDREIKVKEKCKPLEFNWTIPEKYRNLNVVEYLSLAHAALTEGMDEQELERREYRLSQEIIKFKQLDLFDVLRAIIWIINRLTINDIVWGVGRGSSVSSYVLYVIGVHDVDSFAYDLDIDDFLHE